MQPQVLRNKVVKKTKLDKKNSITNMETDPIGTAATMATLATAHPISEVGKDHRGESLENRQR